MLFNVWVLIWPNQKKVLGMVEASAEQVAKAKSIAFMASRSNTLMSIPMVMSMIGSHHGWMM
ncbi:MAG: urate hydroxylase PuuD [Woeseiaceae bacterium]|nr:urate hydroxylase PuuD [Woeseiaceae bacterium]